MKNMTAIVHPTWQTFLDAEGVQALGTPGAYPTAGYCAALPHMAVLELQGSDASGFLQGYLTADTNALDPTRAVFGAYCDIKGRVIADLLVVTTDGGLLLATHQSLVEPIRESLAKYLAFSRCKLIDARNDWLVFGLLGSDVDGATEATAPWAVQRHDGCVQVALPGPTGWLCIATTDQASHVWSTFRDARGGPEPWLEREITAGIAHLEAATSGHFLPQMLGYEELGGLSFSKGCYLGQEVVTRAQHRGQVKRRLGRWTFSDAPPPAAGTPLLDDGDARCGTVIQAAASSPTSGVLLAVVARDRLDSVLRLDGTRLWPVRS